MRWIKKFFKWIVILLVISGILAGGYYWIYSNFTIHPVAGTSMEQSLSDGDKVIIKKTKKISRYDVVAFYHEKKSDMYVKRIVGLPKDRIVVQNQTLIIDVGKHENFKSTIRVQLTPEVANTMMQYSTIPDDKYFVLGDNVDISKDSRSLGLVDTSEIEGTLYLKI